MKFTDAELLEWNRLGLFPSPDESEEKFLERVHNCLRLKEKLELDPSFLQHQTSDILNTPLKEAHHFYGMEPSWIPVVFGNKHLAPWHGGCAWIFQMQEEGPLGAFIQLREAFLRSKTYLNFYQRDEIITHELAHVGRMAYNEPAFEEILAYRSSNRGFTKIFGPIVESSVESVIFLLSLAMVLLVEGYLLFNGEFSHPSLFFGLLALPLALILYGLFRLWRKQSQFNACLNILKLTLNNLQKANSVIYRLTDSEIYAFGKMTPEEVSAYARAESANTLRWRVINNAYFHDHTP